ncbi:hypothetical protein M3Y96_00417000 [Aphelenchoides besseyi]|nr:hypothetical protein M3Y96_00417000 [Aphelenchoides besseyi]
MRVSTFLLCSLLVINMTIPFIGSSTFAGLHNKYTPQLDEKELIRQRRSASDNQTKDKTIYMSWDLVDLYMFVLQANVTFIILLGIVDTFLLFIYVQAKLKLLIWKMRNFYPI